MTKQELAKEIASKTGVDQPTVLACVEGLMATVKDSLAKGDPVLGSYFIILANSLNGWIDNVNS